MITTSLIISFTLSYVYNYTDFIDSIGKGLHNMLNKQTPYTGFSKPFGCGGCMTMWITFIFLLFYINPIYALFGGVLNHLTYRLWKNIQNIIIYLIEKINI